MILDKAFFVNHAKVLEVVEVPITTPVILEEDGTRNDVLVDDGGQCVSPPVGTMKKSVLRGLVFIFGPKSFCSSFSNVSLKENASCGS